jgi:hypothetical protein
MIAFDFSGLNKGILEEVKFFVNDKDGQDGVHKGDLTLQGWNDITSLWEDIHTFYDDLIHQGWNSKTWYLDDDTRPAY